MVSEGSVQINRGVQGQNRKHGMRVLSIAELNDSLCSCKTLLNVVSVRYVEGEFHFLIFRCCLGAIVYMPGVYCFNLYTADNILIMYIATMWYVFVL